MQQMNKIQMFKQGTYVTNGDVTGVVRGYSDNSFGIEFYIAYFRWYENGSFNKNSGYFNDGSFREMDESEINEFNQTLLKCGYIWDVDSMKLTDLKALKETASTDTKENKDMVKKENKPKFKTGDFLTSIDGDETFIFMRYEEDGWLLGWNIVFNVDECCNKCEVQRFNPSHPWQYSADCDKEKFLCKLKNTCYVWYDDVKEMRKEYELGIDKLKCGDIIHFRDGETVIFKELCDNKIIMKVWHAPIDGNVLTEYAVDKLWRYATGDEQDFILDIMAGNGYVWDKGENNFFSNPRMIAINISDNVVSQPHEIQPIIIPEGYIANIDNGKIYFIKEFKDGNFIKTKNGDTIAIFKEISNNGEIIGHVEYFRSSNEFLTVEDVIGHDINQWTLATDEDIKLFKEKLSEHNYKWDEESKKVVKLCWEPQFGETYYFINKNLTIIETENIRNDKNISVHNCFKTIDDAKELLKEMKQMFLNYHKQKYGNK